MTPIPDPSILTAVLILLSLTSHIALGRIRYVAELKERQALEYQKAFVNGGNASQAQQGFQAVQADINDYELLEKYTLYLRAGLITSTVLTAILSLGVNTGLL